MRNLILATLLFATGLTSNLEAADLSTCPTRDQIHSSPYTDPDLPPPHGEGFKYTTDKKDNHYWSGQAASTEDDFLDKKYELVAQSISADGNTCEYGGKTITEGDVTSRPYLKLHKK